VATPVRIIRTERNENEFQLPKLESGTKTSTIESVSTKKQSDSILIENHLKNDLFKAYRNNLRGRYHSWIIAEEGFPEDLKITREMRMIISWLCSINSTMFRECNFI
jgi:anthranilate/para-aminobenzoate synthase component II